MLRQVFFLTRSDLTAILDRPITVLLLLIGVVALLAAALAGTGAPAGSRSRLLMPGGGGEPTQILSRRAKRMILE
jgi:hypothetical protein